MTLFTLNTFSPKSPLSLTFPVRNCFQDKQRPLKGRQNHEIKTKGTKTKRQEKSSRLKGYNQKPNFAFCTCPTIGLKIGELVSMIVVFGCNQSWEKSEICTCTGFILNPKSQGVKFALMQQLFKGVMFIQGSRCLFNSH